MTPKRFYEIVAECHDEDWQPWEELDEAEKQLAIKILNKLMAELGLGLPQ